MKKLLLIAVLVLAPFCAQAQGELLITEIMYDLEGADATHHE